MCSKCSEDKNVRIIVKLGSITEIIDYRLNKSEMHSQKERGDTNWFRERFKGLYTFHISIILSSIYLATSTLNDTLMTNSTNSLYVFAKDFLTFAQLSKKKRATRKQQEYFAEHITFSISSTLEKFITCYFFTYHTALWVKFGLPAPRVFDMHIFSPQMISAMVLTWCDLPKFLKWLYETGTYFRRPLLDT